MVKGFDQVIQPESDPAAREASTQKMVEAFFPDGKGGGEVVGGPIWYGVCLILVAY